jgi:hypothetical protein
MYVLNEQPQTNDKGCFSSLGVEYGADNPSSYKIHLSLRPGHIPWINEPNNRIWIKDSNYGV